MDSSVIPPDTYVKVSGNLRSFQVKIITCLYSMAYFSLATCLSNCRYELYQTSSVECMLGLCHCTFNALTYAVLTDVIEERYHLFLHFMHWKFI